MVARLKPRIRTKTDVLFDVGGNKQRQLEEGADGENCPIVGAIRAMVTESRVLIIRHLATGPKGFNELMRVSGINSKTLSITLKYLEDRGVVMRKIISTKPFSVQYSLSESGEDFRSVLDALGTWGRKWLPGD